MGPVNPGGHCSLDSNGHKTAEFMAYSIQLSLLPPHPAPASAGTDSGSGGDLAGGRGVLSRYRSHLRFRAARSLQLPPPARAARCDVRCSPPTLQPHLRSCAARSHPGHSTHGHSTHGH